MWKEGLVAGIAVLGGFMVLKQTTSKSAESVQFSAPRGFPKKLRLDSNMTLTTTPFLKIFDVEQGMFFSPNATYNENTGKINHMKIMEVVYRDWDSLSERYFPRGNNIYRNDENDSLRKEKRIVVYGYLRNKGLTDANFTFIEATSGLGDTKLDQLKDEFFDKYDVTEISQQEFNDIWQDAIGKRDDRRDAYWDLYSAGVVDNDMDDEPSGVYNRVYDFLYDAISKGITLKSQVVLTEEEEFNKKVKELAKGWLAGDENVVGFNYTSLRPFEDDETPYKPTLEEAEIIVEFAILRANAKYYALWEQNIKPLLDRGWDLERGRIVENNRGTVDAYRDFTDTPDRYRYLYQMVSKEAMEKRLWSEGFVKKRILKRRPVFLRAIKKDIADSESGRAGIVNKLAIESADKIKQGLNLNPPFSNIEYYDRFMDTDYYNDDFYGELNKLLTQAGSELSDADRNKIRPKIEELLFKKKTNWEDEYKNEYDETVAKAKRYYDERVAGIGNKMDKAKSDIDEYIEGLP